MSFIKGFKEGMGEFGHNISIIVNSILLAIVYILGIGLTSIFAKLSRKHFLDLRSKKESYWKELNLKKKQKEDYFRQF